MHMSILPKFPIGYLYMGFSGQNNLIQKKKIKSTIFGTL